MWLKTECGSDKPGMTLNKPVGKDHSPISYGWPVGGANLL